MCSRRVEMGVGEKGGEGAQGPSIDFVQFASQRSNPPGIVRGR